MNAVDIDAETDERAAIREYDGGMDRETAEWMARRDMRKILAREKKEQNGVEGGHATAESHIHRWHG